MYGGAGLAGIASLEDRRLRLLGWALLGSLVLHALILLLLPILRNAHEARVAPPPITAHLAKPVPPQPAPPKAEPLQPRQAARPQPPQVQKRAPQPAPSPVLSTEPSKPAPEPALAVPPAQPQPTGPQAARTETAASASATSGPDPGSVARFRLELMEIARRYKRYPRIAQDNNWEGRVELRVAFAESGAMSALAVRKSAGRTVLDEEAQAMIRSALPHAALPPSLRGKAFTLDIPVDFSLKDER